MKALDLFCCDGGAAMGLHRAGFDEIVGVDIEPHPNYPFEFIQADCLKLPIKDFSGFDFIWASPPCQKYSYAAQKHRNNGKEYPDLVKDTRLLLNKIELPYCIENVLEAPIRKDLLLCGTMFQQKIFRHRKFEVNGFRCEQPRHPQHLGKIGFGYQCVCGDHGAIGFSKGTLWNKKRMEQMKRYVTVAGHGGNGSGKLKDWQDAMGIDWITNKKYLAEAVPPAYSEYIGKEFIRFKENVMYASKT